MEAGLLGGEKVVWEQGLVRWSSEIVGAHARYACTAGNLRQTTTLSWGGLRAGGNFLGDFSGGAVEAPGVYLSPPR